MTTKKIYSDRMVDEQDPRAVLARWAERVKTALRSSDPLMDEAELHPESGPALRERACQILHRVHQEGLFLLKIYGGDGRGRDD